jgi:hypothetical protein
MGAAPFARQGIAPILDHVQNLAGVNAVMVNALDYYHRLPGSATARAATADGSPTSAPYWWNPRYRA